MYTALCTFILTLIFAINVREKNESHNVPKMVQSQPTLMKY